MLERKAVQKVLRCFSLEDTFVQEGKSHLGRRGYKVVQTRFPGPEEHMRRLCCPWGWVWNVKIAIRSWGAGGVMCLEEGSISPELEGQ